MLSLAVVVGYEASILTEANTDSSPALGRDQDASCGRGIMLCANAEQKIRCLSPLTKLTYRGQGRGCTDIASNYFILVHYGPNYIMETFRTI